MAYAPTVWATGDVVTAAKLNKLEQGVADSESSAFVIRSGDNVFLLVGGSEPITFEQMGTLWEEHNGNIIVRHSQGELPPSALYFKSNAYETSSFGIYTYGGLNEGLGVSTKHIVLTSDGYMQDTEGTLFGIHTWIVSAQNDD